MTQASAVAHANLAFVKYWGKTDPDENIPTNNSISMNLSAAQTFTTVTFDAAQTADHVLLDGQPASAKFTARVTKHLDRLRTRAGVSYSAIIQTRNTFPAGAGFASSASGFAALTVAAAAALNLTLSEKTLSILARKGSGSACRSVPGGFVEWLAGTCDTDSYAVSIAPAEHWDIVDVAVVVSTQEKAVSSSGGHALAKQSPFWSARLAQMPDTLERTRRALLDRDFETFGRMIEQEALSMHTVMMTSAHEADGAWRSGLYYWLPDTLDLIAAAQQWRSDGLPVYFTLDAGPTMHLICPAEYETQVIEAVQERQKARGWSILVNHPAPGAQLLPDMLEK